MAIENTIGRAYGTIPIEVEIPWQAVATGTVVVLIGTSTVKFLVVLAQSSRLNDGHDYFCADLHSSPFQNMLGSGHFVG